MTTPPAVGQADDRADLTRAVIGIWEERLGVDDIGPDEDFFDLGGHSLHAVQLISQIEQTFGAAIALRDFYLAPTVTGVVDRMVAAAAVRD